MQKAQKLGISRSRQHAPAFPGGRWVRARLDAGGVSARICRRYPAVNSAEQGLTQPWRNPSLAVMMVRPISSTGEMKPFIGLGSWEVFDVGPDRAARRPLREVLSLLIDFRRTSARQLADVRPSRRSPRRFVDRNGGATRCFPRDQGIERRARSDAALSPALAHAGYRPYAMHNLVD